MINLGFLVRIYLIVSGALFGFVALLHTVRAVNAWGLQLGPLEIPMWISWTGLLLTAALSVCALYLVNRKPDLRNPA